MAIEETREQKHRTKARAPYRPGEGVAIFAGGFMNRGKVVARRPSQDVTLEGCSFRAWSVDLEGDGERVVVTEDEMVPIEKRERANTKGGSYDRKIKDPEGAVYTTHLKRVTRGYDGSW